METEVFICECFSYEHQVKFWHDEEYGNFIHAYFHLVTYRGFFKRLWHGLKYAFGYTSRFGAWDQFIFSIDNESKLRDYLNNKQKQSNGQH